MPSNHHTDEVFKEKRKPKRPIRFGITLNEEQKLAKAEILHHDITAIKGKAGSGKTMLAVQTGLDQLFNKVVEVNYCPAFCNCRRRYWISTRRSR